MLLTINRAKHVLRSGADNLCMFFMMTYYIVKVCQSDECVCMCGYTSFLNFVLIVTHR